MRRLATAVIAFSVAITPLAAQQLIGYVNARDADATGVTDVLDGQAVLTGSVTVTAKDHTAPITLGRGGSVHVCQTSVLHLSESRTPLIPAPLLFSLDRGAFEIQTNSTPNDSIMTPDLRFSVHNTGPLDLRLRIARNGDTCVDNRGPGAPTLAVSDPFGEAQYEVGPGQHVLFEHGSLHEVVDHETSPCGCPDEKGVSIADALLASPKAVVGAAPAPVAPPPPTPSPVISAPASVAAAPSPTPSPATPPPQPAPPPAPVTPLSPPSGDRAGSAPAIVAPAPQPAPPPAPVAAAPTAPAPVAAAPTAPAPPAVPEQAVEQAAAVAAARAAALHPFPTAISEGLAPADPPPPPAPSSTAVPTTEPLRYNAPVEAAAAVAPSAPAGKAPKAKAAPTTPAQAKPAPPATPPPNDLVHVLGRFFKRLFTW